MDKTINDFQALVEIVKKLRGPGGCPWDQEQTQQSLTQFILEEAFELVDAIESGHQKEIQEELGDYLFQVILQAQVAQDAGYFELQNILESLNQKLITRHPHVFAGIKVENSQEVWKQWHKMKNAEAEKKQKPIFSYPRNLPALQASFKIGKKTEGFRFDWKNSSEVVEKIHEEMNETEEALSSKDNQHIEHEIGDLLFSVAQLARHQDLDPEACLRKANRRFEGRFQKVLELSGKTQEEFCQLNESQMNELWIEAKLLLEKNEANYSS